tara:strand:- start:358 stop:501 length:144 start_codon:yes stop_codon:yes gene_type:complete
MQNHGYSLQELETMIPWEREIYIALLQDHIKKENEKMQEMQRKMRTK